METFSESQEQNKLLTSREPYFMDSEYLGDRLISCGDDRPLNNPNKPYFHLFGGAPFLIFNQLITNDAIQAGVFDKLEKPIEDFVADTLPYLTKNLNIKPAVHSDENTEHGDSINTTQEEGSVGCKYWDARLAISSHIANSANALLDEATHFVPELFTEKSDIYFGQNVMRAHGRFSERKDLLPSGRGVVVKSIKAGAKGLVLSGNHEADSGIVNLVPNTLLNTYEADKAGVPVYTADLWIVGKIDSDKRLLVASVIDTLATLQLLGVKKIAFRKKTLVPATS